MRLRLTFTPRIILSRRVNVAYFLHRVSYEPLIGRVLRLASLNFTIIKMTASCRAAAAGCRKCGGRDYARTRRTTDSHGIV